MQARWRALLVKNEDQGLEAVTVTRPPGNSVQGPSARPRRDVISARRSDFRASLGSPGSSGAPPARGKAMESWLLLQKWPREASWGPPAPTDPGFRTPNRGLREALMVCGLSQPAGGWRPSPQPRQAQPLARHLIPSLRPRSRAVGLPSPHHSPGGSPRHRAGAPRQVPAAGGGGPAARAPGANSRLVSASAAPTRSACETAQAQQLPEAALSSPGWGWGWGSRHRSGGGSGMVIP